MASVLRPWPVENTRAPQHRSQHRRRPPCPTTGAHRPSVYRAPAAVSGSGSWTGPGAVSLMVGDPPVRRDRRAHRTLRMPRPRTGVPLPVQHRRGHRRQRRQLVPAQPVGLRHQPTRPAVIVIRGQRPRREHRRQILLRPLPRRPRPRHLPRDRPRRRTDPRQRRLPNDPHRLRHHTPASNACSTQGRPYPATPAHACDAREVRRSEPDMPRVGRSPGRACTLSPM